MAQVSVAWCLAKDGVSAPIVGTTSLSNLEDIISTLSIFYPKFSLMTVEIVFRTEAANITLTEDEIKYLEEPYQPQAIVGHS